MRVLNTWNVEFIGGTEGVLFRIINMVGVLFGFSDGPTKRARKAAKKAVQKVAPIGTPWYDVAKTLVGVHEGPGRKNNPMIVDLYREAGFPGIKHDSVPWCAAFVGAMLERAGYASAKSLTARDYLRWGKKVAKPYEGCIAVFKRGNSSWQGHVAFFVRETKTHVYVLGGNQSNAVNVARYPKSKLLGYRKPVTTLNSRTTVVAAVGNVTGSALLAFADPMADVVTPFLTIGQELKGLGEMNALFAYAGVAVIIAASLAGVYFRWDDASTKGR